MAFSNWYPKAEELIQNSFLSDDYKKDYSDIIKERVSRLKL